MNYLPILVAGVVSFIVGFIWYSPAVFGNVWMQLAGISKADMDDAKKKGMMGSMFAGLIAQFVMAYVLSMFMTSAGATDVKAGMQTAFWLWLGFVATIMLGTVLWERRPSKLYALNALHWLVALLAMAAVLGSMT